MTKVASVTGGTRGIGAVIAPIPKDSGCRVAVTYQGDAVAAVLPRNDGHWPDQLFGG